DHLGADDEATELPRHPTHERGSIGRKPDLDDSEPGDVRSDELAQEVVPCLLSLLLEDLASRGRLLHGMGTHGDGAVRRGINKEGISGLQTGVQYPALGQRNEVGRAAGEL